MAIIGIERTERDASQVITPVAGEPFGMVLRVPYGPLKPIIIDREEVLLDYFSVTGKPNPSYRDYYEAIIMLKQTPIMACRPQGDALFGGVAVSSNQTGGLTVGLVTGVSDPDSYSFTDTDIQFLILAADPSADNNNYSVEIATSSSTVDNTFDIELYYNDVLTQTFNVSLLKTQLDGFGNSVYIEEIIKNRSDIQVVVNTNAILDVLPATTVSPVDFSGGVTITAFNDAVTNAAWDNFRDFNKYFTHYLVDTSCDPEIGNNVDDISQTNFYQFSYLGAPSIKSTNPRATESLNTWLTNVQAYRDVNGILLGLNSDHSTLYSNWARVTDNYNNTTVWVSPVALAASRKAFTLQNISISQAAVGANAQRGVIDEVIEFEQDPTTVVDTLDADQINVNTYSPAGPVVWNEKTLQVNFTNTSFISHRTYFFTLEEAIERALFFFVFTDINDEVRTELRSLIESFTNPQIGVHAEDIQVRVPKDDALAAQRRLKVQVAVIPFPKANKILFEFISSRTGVDLNEVF